MQRRKTVVIGIICVLTLALAVNLVHAGNANTASVWATSDSLGNTKANTFAVGQTVYIWWTAYLSDGTAGTVDIKIIDTAGNTVGGPWINQAIGAQPLTWTAQLGYY